MLFWICFIFCPKQRKHCSIEKFAIYKYDKLYLVHIKVISFCTKYLKICLGINIFPNLKQMLVNLFVYFHSRIIYIYKIQKSGLFFKRLSQNTFFEVKKSPWETEFHRIFPKWNINHTSIFKLRLIYKNSFNTQFVLNISF